MRLRLGVTGIGLAVTGAQAAGIEPATPPIEDDALLLTTELGEQIVTDQNEFIELDIS